MFLWIIWMKKKQLYVIRVIEQSHIDCHFLLVVLSILTILTLFMWIYGDLIVFHHFQMQDIFLPLWMIGVSVLGLICCKISNNRFVYWPSLFHMFKHILMWFPSTWAGTIAENFFLMNAKNFFLLEELCIKHVLLTIHKFKKKKELWKESTDIYWRLHMY